MGAEAAAIDTKEEEDKGRAMILANVVKQWNGFIKGLLSATLAWEAYRDTRLDNAVELEEFPLKIQKMFYLANPHGDFSLLVEDVMTQPNIKEHLKTLLISIK